MLKMRAPEAGRFALQGVFLYTDAVGRQHVQVTDGRRLAAAVLSRDPDDDVTEQGVVLVKADGLDDIMRLKPSKNDVRVNVEKADEKAVGVVVGTDAGDLAGTLDVVKGQFPATDDVWPRTTKLESRAAFDVDYMIDALRAIKKAGSLTAILSRYGERAPVLIEPSVLAGGLESFHVLLMPVSRSNDEAWSTRAMPETGHRPVGMGPGKPWNGDNDAPIETPKAALDAVGAGMTNDSHGG